MKTKTISLIVSAPYSTALVLASALAALLAIPAAHADTFYWDTLADQFSGSLLDGDSKCIWDLNSGSNTWQFTESTGLLGLTVIPEPNVAALLGGLGMAVPPNFATHFTAQAAARQPSS